MAIGPEDEDRCYGIGRGGEMNAGGRGEATGMRRTAPYAAAGALGRFAAAFVALALTLAPAGAQSPIDGWACRQIEDLSTFTVSTPAYLLNNFRLREADDYFSDWPALELSFSAVNQLDERLPLSAQFIGLGRIAEDRHRPKITISATPDFGAIGAMRTEQVRETVYSQPGELDLIAAFCLRIDP